MSGSHTKGFLSRLAGGAGAGLEHSADGVDMRSDRVKTSVHRLEQCIVDLGGGALTPEEQGNLLANARSGLKKIADEGDLAELTPREGVGLEAIIIADGSRPALLIQDGSIPMDHDGLGKWHGKALTMQAGIRSVIRRLGRVDSPSSPNGFEGTGFVIDCGVIATNRHVLERIARERPTGWQLKPDVAIDFGHEFGRDTVNRYPIKRVLFAGPDITRLRVDFEHLDLAVLETETGPEYPPPTLLSEDTADVVAEAPVYTVGYPARPRGGDSDVLARLFANTFGCKRWSPGYVTKGPGELAKDSKSWIVSHDATTLGGSSGSAVIAFTGSGSVCVGLHFSGTTGVANYAHAIAMIRDELATR